jgi:hypothetical protein
MALIQEKKLMADIKKSAKAGQMVRKIQPSFSVHQRLMHTYGCSLQQRFKPKISFGQDAIFKSSLR